MNAFVIKDIVDGSLIYNVLNHSVTRAITDANPFKDWWSIDIVVCSDERLDLSNDERKWEEGDILLDGNGIKWYVESPTTARKIVSKNDERIVRNFELGIYFHGSRV